MIMRTEPGLKLERSPLQFVLVQVRFSPVLKMPEYVSSFQDKLRKSGFPGYSKGRIRRFTFDAGGESDSDSQIESSTRWAFGSREKREGVVLTNDFVIYETTQYETFETFTPRFKDVLTELNAVAEIDSVTQIGLRYIDVVRSLDGHSPNWFIREQFHGLSSGLVEAEEVKNQFLSLVKTPEGYLKLKSLEGHGPAFMPPDLEASRLEFDLKLSADDRFRILDFDHIWEGQIDFAPDEIIERMRSLHEWIKKVFLATVTESALEVWESMGDER